MSNNKCKKKFAPDAKPGVKESKPEGKPQSSTRVQGGPKDPRSKGRNYNDPKWRQVNPELANQVNNYSFVPALGTDVNISTNLVGSTVESGKLKSYTTCVLRLNPSPGRSAKFMTHAAAINQAGLRTFTLLSSSNAKTTNYQPQDVTMILLALGDCISLFSHIRRLLRLATMYNLRNRIYPKKFIRMLGVDPDDLIQHLAQYRISYNMLCVKAGKIPFPGNIDYFYNCAALYNDVFLDEPNNPMAQVYAYVPYSMWLFEETGTEEGTLLGTVGLHADNEPSFGNATPKVSDLLEKLSIAMDKLLESSTLNYVYADVVKYCTNNNVPSWTVQPLSETEGIVPVYSEEALLQIHNASICGAPDSNNVTASVDENGIVYAPLFKKSTVALACDKVIDFPTSNPSVDDKTSAARFLVCSPAATYDATAQKYIVPARTPDHYVVDVTFYADNETPKYTIDDMGTVGTKPVHGYAIPKFRMAPITYAMTGSGNAQAFFDLVGEMNYFTTLEPQKVMNVQDVAYYGLFDLH